MNKNTEDNAVEPDRIMASIVRIDNIVPIAGADKIVVAEVAGWKCVVGKDEFKIGDLAVYYCEDSMPNLEDDNLQFLKTKGIKRIKIMKIRGVVSQGLLGPLKWLEGKVSDLNSLKIGDDLTEILKVKKYVKTEEIEQYGGRKKTLNPFSENFPQEIPKTDADRLQNNLDYIKKIINREIVITRKEDGCSCTFMFKNGKFGICSRNFLLLEGNENSKNYFHIENKYSIKEKMTNLNKNIAIQGEIIGPKINGNKMELKQIDFEVFNIFDIDKREYMNYEEVIEICKRMELKHVPLLYLGNISNLEFNLENERFKFGELFENQENSNDFEKNIKKALNGFIEMSNQLDYSKNLPAEGFVLKTNDLLQPKINFKVISNRFSLKYA